MDLLVVEDDADTRYFLERALRELGHTTTVCADGREALLLITEQNFDVIILDRMLPIMDGLTVLKALRSANVMTPVLMLTALARVEDRVDGLEAGADDYLVKPFALSELTARLAAVARRHATLASDTILRAGAIEMDLLRREVRRAGKLIELQPREFTLLEELVRAEGRVLTRTMLLERVWDFRFDPLTNIVETHISRLRGKLNAGFADDAISTIRGAGYKISTVD